MSPEMGRAPETDQADRAVDSRLARNGALICSCSSGTVEHPGFAAGWREWVLTPTINAPEYARGHAGEMSDDLAPAMNAVSADASAGPRRESRV